MQTMAFIIASNFACCSPILIATFFLIHCFLFIYFGDQFVALEIRYGRHHCRVCQQSTWYSAL